MSWPARATPSGGLAFSQASRAFFVQAGGGRTRAGCAGTQTRPPTTPAFPSEARGALKVFALAGHDTNAGDWDTRMSARRKALFSRSSSLIN
ncbi:hypothetical protein ACFOEY_17190 [Paracandidimonas soli]|uniref:hypothetical protein n=1 Tax=Paracandidimonas soli TaxID=1917182 RepID=UPI0036129E65